MKEFYIAPELQVLVVYNEGIICSSDNYGNPGSAGGGSGHNNQGGF
jgi:hypothetical protein